MVASTGARLTSLTVMTTTSLSASEPSEAINVTLKAPDCVKLGVQVKVPVPLRLLTKLAPEGTPTALIVGVVPSGSVAVSLNVRSTPSLTFFGPMVASTGARLTLLTVMTTTSLSASEPSEAINVTLKAPDCVKFGVHVKVPVPLRLLTKLAPEGTPTALIVGVVPSGSVAVSLNVRSTPSLTLFAPIVARIGARFTLLTVIATTSLSARAPSDAMTVTLKTPLCVKSGLKLKVPVPLPLFVNVALVGTLSALRVGIVPSASEAEATKLRFAPSLTLLGPIVARTGALPARAKLTTK